MPFCLPYALCATWRAFWCAPHLLWKCAITMPCAMTCAFHNYDKQHTLDFTFENSFGELACSHRWNPITTEKISILVKAALNYTCSFIECIECTCIVLKRKRLFRFRKKLSTQFLTLLTIWCHCVYIRRGWIMERSILSQIVAPICIPIGFPFLKTVHTLPWNALCCANGHW